MPTYDYVCDACGHKFEEMQPFSADPLKTCPACGKDTLRRLFGTGAAVLFKGGGFYETDYRSESYKKAAEKEKSSRDGGEKSASDSGEKKNVETKKASEPAASDTKKKDKRPKAD